jgi:hypothetical protein
MGRFFLTAVFNINKLNEFWTRVRELDSGISGRTCEMFVCIRGIVYESVLSKPRCS